MLISQAFAQAPEALTAGADVAAQLPAAPSPFVNFGLLAVMVVLFYVLLIMPQQKRFKEHGKMLSALEKGDEIVTGGGLIGTVAKIVSDDELEIDLGNKLIVRARRSSVSGKVGETPVAIAAAEAGKKPVKKPPVKKPAAKKAPAKKTEGSEKKAPAKKTAVKKAPSKAANDSKDKA